MIIENQDQNTFTETYLTEIDWFIFWPQYSLLVFVN